LGKSKKTAVFPKLLFTIRNGVNHKKGDPNYDIKQLALECASKRMYPDILNYDKVVEVTGSFKAPMGCRSFLGLYLDENGNEVHEGRNNLGVVSLNLPRIAIEAKGDESKFFEILDQRIQIVRKALETRIDRLRNIKAKVAPILYTEGALGVRLNPDDNVFEIFKNGRASISMGYIGIHEAINALYGQDEHIYDSEFLREKGIAIVKRLKEAVDTWKEETGFGYSLYSTPSENLCTRFCALDSKEFGVIEGVTDKGYYTNSFHLDVEKKVNPYDKIDFEMPYPELSSGGFICYGEFPNMQHNIEALENVWDYSYDRVPYYGTNTPIDECYECGFTGEFDCTSKGFVCPKCGNHDPKKVSVTRRVCGYLGSPDARPFNSGKQAEVIRRVKHYGNI
ncbi:anaerobic ribonucleoside-triphosphate reductase, partial [Vibrio parahaemolyticus]|nr:anaerobic ribonucleoside-triphosphate reductase [Vibrio parahaemolyticus]